MSVFKSQKSRMRVYAEPSKKRRGNENDSEVFERILSYWETNHPVQDKSPKPTYEFKTI